MARVAPVLSTILLVTLPLPVTALQKDHVRMDRAGSTGWDASASCTVTYANTCTGWLWVWGDWLPLESFGVIFQPCCDGATLTSTQAYFWSGAPTGWGFTGTLSIHTVVSECPGPVIASHLLVPPLGPVVDFWTAPAGPVALTFRNGPVTGSPARLPTDHPAAGPTGPQSCGFCFPSTRVTHTFRFGTVNAPLCPGDRFQDDVCDAEALFWYAGFDCPVSLETSTWGALKALYR